jgi:hypothetical protein
MADLLRCKEQISHVFQQDSSFIARFSDLTRQARWTEKASCIQEFGSLSAVQQYLAIWMYTEQKQPNEHQIADWTWSQEQEKEQTTTQVHNSANEFDFLNSSWEEIWWFIQSWLYIVLLVIFGICILKILQYALTIMYDVLQVKRMVYFRVILPRGDSKNDREREKELAKDMKEKIWRMSQVFSSLHKLGELSFEDNVMRWLFNKPKISFITHYEQWMLSFLVGVYPEYKNIVEWAISAQYSDASMEMIENPQLFKWKYHEIIPMQPIKSSYYPIRIFKQLEDDPLNNIIDSIGKMSSEDTFSIVMTIRPERGTFNKNAQKLANALFKKDQTVLNPESLRKKLLPWNLFSFLINWPSQALIEKFSSSEQRWDPMIRMVKAEEEAYNIMAEEAAKPAFTWWLMLISSWDDSKRVQENIYNLVSAYSIYKDEYNNGLDQPETLADLLWPIIKPLWKMSLLFAIPWLWTRDNTFTVGELSSLFHLPDGMFNRSPIIKWMDYKVVAWPDTLPIPTDPTGYIMWWVIADSYKWGDLNKILTELKHPAIATREIEEEKRTELDATYIAKPGDEIMEENWKKRLITKTKKTITWLRTYNDAILLWLNVYRNKYAPVYMKRKDRTRHHYIIWKSGTGKSVFISAMARQDIWSGDGICVIDPHWDLVEDILQYVPKERARDVVYFDAGNEERPMWLNLYEISHPAEADRAVNDATEMFIKMFGAEIFWPRIQEYFKFGSLTLLEDMEEWATLLDVPRLFTDEVYREYKTKKVKNPVTRNFREKTYNAMGDREKQEIIPYFTSKFVSFSTNSLIRNIIWQTKSAFNFAEVMDNKKILLINLSKGKIGELNAQLLGMILVSKIYNAAMARARMEEKDRQYFFLYVDEFQNFVTDTFADILSEARKYKLALIMAHQFISQLDSNSGNNIGEWKSKVKDAVFGNVWSMMSFKVGAPDAEFLEKEYTPVLGAQDILWIANYKAYVKLNINNSTSRAFSMNTIWTEDYKNPKMGDVLKQYCEKKYGRKKEFVDAEIAARLWMMSANDEEMMNDANPANAELWAWETPTQQTESEQTEESTTA